MIALVVFSGILLVLLCVLLWRAYGQLTASHTGEVSARLPVEFLIPRKPAEMRQAREELRAIQAELDKQHVLTAEKWRLLKARNKVARELLSAIHEDFVRLDRLMCAMAAVSPEVCREKEFERLWLALRFGARYRTALLCISFGTLPAQSITGLQILTKDQTETFRTLLRAVDATLAGNFGKSHILKGY